MYYYENVQHFCDVGMFCEVQHLWDLVGGFICSRHELFPSTTQSTRKCSKAKLRLNINIR